MYDARNAEAPLSDLLRDGQLLVCCGPGGVGKTTTAAALGLRAVLMGRKAIVLTIDPAKRLANSLGLSKLTNTPQQIDLEALSNDATDEGELWAMMLDQEKTFEELVDRAAPDQGAVERSKDNNIYKLLSSALHGMQEYAALDKLHDIYTSGHFDLVILDTPPTTSAIEFLQAPKRLSQFFDQRIMKWFLPDSSSSTGFIGKIFNPGSVVLKLLSKVTGQDFVDDLVEFFDTFHYLQDTLKERSEVIEYILQAPNTHFLLVTTAAPRRIEEVFHFHQKLGEIDQEARAFIVNRVTPPFSLSDLESIGVDDMRTFLNTRANGELDGETVDELLDQMEDHYASLARLADRDRQSIDELGDRVGRELLQLVPVLGEDVHSLEHLLELSKFLTPDQPPAQSAPT
jgi:anion-transporting  ArsA/GET3 family ATPase